jgi:hypothetical protein
MSYSEVIKNKKDNKAKHLKVNKGINKGNQQD